MRKVTKAIEITDAKIQYVSLVDKAANLKQFLVTKQADGKAQFSTYSKILKVDAATHYITGIVYEPMAEDAHGNFMTAEEIQKAAYYFAKNGDKIDLQHSFESCDGLTVVENYIAPCDLTIGDAQITKGTWLITVECANDDVWQAIEKGELTGFSMGGFGKYSEEDVDLEETVQKGQTPAPEAAPAAPDVPEAEKKSLLKRLSEFFGFEGYEVVEKGAVADLYESRAKADKFWDAFWSLEDVLYHYDWDTDRYIFVSDPAIVREALTEFSTILTDILAEPDDTIVKSVALAFTPEGNALSEETSARLGGITKTLSQIREGRPIVKEENDMDEKKMAEIMKNVLVEAGLIKKAEETPAAPAAAPQDGIDITAEVEKAVRKALVDAGVIEEEPTPEEPSLEDTVQKAVEQAVANAVEPLRKAFGVPSNLNNAGNGGIQKNEQHYLHGIL